ncbi:uncharacterized protein LOC129958597 isoform X2 [Argiope bruennichi]|uniref:uncharacterized protein LOC129958597 isoform X2 n=1 Tax=Argiope bruennichi TaxID=94029 RepID=UPI00249522B0|nr:uncharacterized protein LOC129958597 isoform X2 [Argiope bruennichi]
MGPPNRPNDIEIVHSLHDLRLKYAKMEINILQNCPYKDVKKDYKPFCHFLERLELPVDDGKLCLLEESNFSNFGIACIQLQSHSGNKRLSCHNNISIQRLTSLDFVRKQVKARY